MLHIISCFSPLKMMNMKCNSCALSLLLFLSPLVSGYKWWPFLKQEPPTLQFDYLRLIFHWPNSFCNVPDGKCIPPVPDYFSLHSFWPQKDNGDPLEYCSKTKMPDQTLDQLKNDLVKIWPDLRARNWMESKEFYKQQWSKHGTCSESKFGPKEYLETALKLGGKYNLYTMLKNNKPDPIVPDPTKLYLTKKIWDAVSNGVRKMYPDLNCNKRRGQHGDEYQLYEIHLCFRFQKVGESEELNMINCDGVVRCEGEKEAYYPNTDKTAISHVPSEKALVSELENAAEL